MTMAVNQAPEGYKPHFGGLWAQVGPETEFDPLRRAMVFLGDCYVVFFEFDPSKKALSYSSYTYLVEDDQIFLVPMVEDTEDYAIIAWDITEDGQIVLESELRRGVYAPVLVEDLAEDGFPTAGIEAYRKAYASNGIPHTIEGMVWLPPTVKVTEKLRPKQREK